MGESQLARRGVEGEHGYGFFCGLDKRKQQQISFKASKPNNNHILICWGVAENQPFSATFLVNDTGELEVENKERGE